MEQTGTYTAASVTLTDDRMLAVLELDVEIKPRPEIHVAEILRDLENLGVSHGVEKDLIGDVVNRYNRGEEVDSTVFVATGAKPRHGIDGRIECLVKRPRNKTKILEDGSVDFKNVESIPLVKTGQELYRRNPGVDGEDGVDVCGKRLRARQAVRVELPLVKHAAPKADDPDVLVSQIDGCIIFENDEFLLSKCYFVNGDVDYSTGNIRYNGSVKVTGDVKAGFVLGAVGTIEIDGTVEDATIKAGGDVVIKGGFVGTGKGSITARGKVCVGFVRNQSITAEKGICIGKEAVDSTLYSNAYIKVIGKGLGLAGGSAFAVDTMELSSLGTEAETKTEVKMGGDPNVVKQLREIDEKLDKLKKKSAYYAAQLEGIQNAKKKSKNLFEKMLEKMETVMEEKTLADMDIEKLEKQKGELLKANKICENPTLRVAGTIYPGVVLTFIGFRRSIDTVTRAGTFTLERGSIRESLF